MFGKPEKNARKKQMILIMTVCIVLAALLFLKQSQENGQELSQGILRSDRDGDVRQETFIARTEDGERAEIPIEIFSRELPEEEKQELLMQAQHEFEQSYLGDNQSQEQVTENLRLASRYADGQVMAVFESSQPQYLWDDGTVHTDILPEEFVPVRLTVNFTCRDMSMECIYYVNLMQKTLTEDGNGNTEIQKAVEEQEAASREQQTFLLPDTVGGQKVVWSKRVDYRPLFFPIAGLLLIICIQQKPLQDKKKEQKLREKELQKEYPAMVMQMSLLMSAGMTAVTAWDKIAGRYDQKKQAQSANGIHGKMPLYLEEMRITCREIRDGGNVRRSWEAFGNRIGLASYRKFVSLLIQNMDKGTKDTAFLLGQEAELVVEEQKNRARRLGEEAGTKLLFPMLMMLMVILAIIMIPAMMSF